MGTAKVEKVLIATHAEDRDALLKTLQEEGLLHISDSVREDGNQPTRDDYGMRTKGGEKNKDVTYQGSPKDSEGFFQVEEDFSGTLQRLTQGITFLSAYAGKRKGGGMFSVKPSLPTDEFSRRVSELNVPGKLKRIGEMSARVSGLEKEERFIKSELEILSPWQTLPHPPREYSSLKKTDVRFISVQAEEKEALEALLEPFTVSVGEAGTQGKTNLLVLLAPREETAEVDDVIKSKGIRTYPLEKFGKKVNEEISDRDKRLEQISLERKGITEEAHAMSAELSGFETAFDFYDNERLRIEERSKLTRSEKASFIEGWVREKDYKRLEKIVHEFPASEVVKAKPREDEQAPVALENATVLKPFEMLMNLYGSPDGREADPTPFMTPFFAVFFGLCMTDAGYGLIITLVTAYLIWIKKIRGNLIWILFYGGITTIIGGALTSSWFGNLPDMLGIPWLVKFRNAFVWFDPIKDPMPFLYLSLAAGYIQMVFGVAIEFFDNLRLRNIAAALFEALPWLLIFVCVPLIIVAGTGAIPKWLGLPLLILVLVSAGVSIVLSNRPGHTSVTSAILFWAVITAGLLALAKAAGGIPFPGKIIKGVLIGLLAALWLYTVFKGLSEKNLKAAGIVLGILGVASLVLYVTGVTGSNAFLIIVFILNLLFAMMVLKTWGGRLAWGLYGIYSNATGVLGIVLSYVRLMALGMMTGGIATAFNLIAWMLGGIPVVSIVLILAVLVIGHGYNLVMSALGAFVHSLRLQYVEFFPRFFTGGGLKFEPFEFKTRYIKVIRRT